MEDLKFWLFKALSSEFVNAYLVFSFLYLAIPNQGELHYRLLLLCGGAFGYLFSWAIGKQVSDWSNKKLKELEKE